MQGKMVNLPPSRRFSAAPFLNCPHKATSAAQSLMSLTSQTFSIDSSESMITVIQVTRGPDKRSSNGSLIYNDSNIMLPRSPLSPRSPSRCSPSLLTPNAAEMTTFEQSFSQPIATTIDTTSISTTTTTTITTTASITSTTVIATDTSTVARPSHFNPIRRIFVEPQGELIQNQLNICDDEVTQKAGSTTASISALKNSNMTQQSSWQDSRHVLDTDDQSSLDANTMIQSEAIPSSEHDRAPKSSFEDIAKESKIIQNQDMKISPAGDSNLTPKKDEQPEADTQDPLELGAFKQPEFRSAVNDFCVRHSREELEFLIGQVGQLRISDCYFSEKRTTLCMVIEVKDK